MDGQFCESFVTGVILISASVHVRQITLFIKCAVFGVCGREKFDPLPNTRSVSKE